MGGGHFLVAFLAFEVACLVICDHKMFHIVRMDYDDRGKAWLDLEVQYLLMLNKHLFVRKSSATVVAEWLFCRLVLPLSSHLIMKNRAK